MIGIGEPRLQPEITLRHTALWYPNVPPRDINLNESYLSSDFWHDPSVYEPMSWVRFGGENGQRLRQLTNIQAIVGDIDIYCLLQIAFQYGDDEVKVPKRENKLGMVYCGGLDEFETRTINFDIDGPGGELITAIDLLYGPWPDVQYGKRRKPLVVEDMDFSTIEVRAIETTLFRPQSILLSYAPLFCPGNQLHTNRGRSMILCCRGGIYMGRRRVKIDPSQTITGFYANQVSC